MENDNEQTHAQAVVMEDGANDDILEVKAKAMTVVVAVAVNDDANVDEDNDDKGPPPTKKLMTNRLH